MIDGSPTLAVCNRGADMRPNALPLELIVRNRSQGWSLYKPHAATQVNADEEVDMYAGLMIAVVTMSQCHIHCREVVLVCQSIGKHPKAFECICVHR